MKLSLSSIGLNRPASEVVAGAVDAVQAYLDIIEPAGGDSNFHNYVNATGSWSSADESSLGNDQTASSFRAPGIDASLGAIFDGSTRIEQTVTTGDFTVVMTFTKGASTNGVLISGIRNGAYVQYNSGDSTAISGLKVDGSTVADRGALYTVLNDGLEHTVEITGMTIGSGTVLDIGRGSVAAVGSVRRLAVLDEDALGGDLASAITAATAAVEATD